MQSFLRIDIHGIHTPLQGRCIWLVSPSQLGLGIPKRKNIAQNSLHFRARIGGGSGRQRRVGRPPEHMFSHGLDETSSGLQPIWVLEGRLEMFVEVATARRALGSSAGVHRSREEGSNRGCGIVGDHPAQKRMVVVPRGKGSAGGGTLLRTRKQTAAR